MLPTVKVRGKVPIVLKSLASVSAQEYVPRGTLNVGLNVRLIVPAMVEVYNWTKSELTAAVTAACTSVSTGMAPDSSVY